MFWKRDILSGVFLISQEPNSLFLPLGMVSYSLSLLSQPPFQEGSMQPPNPVSSLRGPVSRGSLLGAWAQNTVQQELLCRRGLWNEVKRFDQKPGSHLKSQSLSCNL